MNEFKFPSSFQLFGRTINVKFDERIIDEHEAIGLTKYRESTIILHKNTPNCMRSQEEIEQTFFHELLHWILTLLKEDALSGNERFIENVSQLLHQAVKTAKYENN